MKVLKNCLAFYKTKIACNCTHIIIEVYNVYNSYNE